MFVLVAMQPVLVQEPRPVPKLDITWDCGDCEHNHKVVPLIQQAYAEETQGNSFAISRTDVAEVAITDIRQAPLVCRSCLESWRGNTG